MLDQLLDQFPDDFDCNSHKVIGSIAAQTWGIQVERDDVNTVLKRRYGGPTKEKLGSIVPDRQYYTDTEKPKFHNTLQKRSQPELDPEEVVVKKKGNKKTKLERGASPDGLLLRNNKLHKILEVYDESHS